MLKKYILGILLSISMLGLFSFPLYAQEERELAPDEYTITDYENIDYEQLYDSIEGLGSGLESEYDYNYDSLTPEQQEMAEGLAALFGGAFLFVFGFMMVFGLVTYVVVAWAGMVIAKKMGIKDPWMSWVPILNLVMFSRMAGITEWSVLLILVPGINGIYAMVLIVLATMKACEKFGLEKMLSLLMLLPVVNIFFFGYLAWGKHNKKVEVATKVNE